MFPEVKAKKEPLPFTAPQRVQAVLAITEKVLSQWETRALSGMLKALEAQSKLEPGPALSPKLERLLARQALQQQGRMAQLEKRLAKLQAPKAPPQPKAPPPPSK